MSHLAQLAPLVLTVASSRSALALIKTPHLLSHIVHIPQTSTLASNPASNALTLTAFNMLLTAIYPHLTCTHITLTIIHLLLAGNRFTLAYINKLLTVVYLHPSTIVFPLPIFICDQPAFVLHMSQTINSIATPIYPSQAP